MPRRKGERDGGAKRQDQVGHNKEADAEGEHAAAAEAIREHACRICREGVDDVHHDHDGGHERDRHANVLRAQDEKCFAESRECQHDRDGHHRPERHAEARDIGELWSGLRTRTALPCRLFDTGTPFDLLKPIAHRLRKFSLAVMMVPSISNSIIACDLSKAASIARKA
jgi:hypothetical protein